MYFPVTVGIFVMLYHIRSHISVIHNHSKNTLWVIIARPIMTPEGACGNYDNECVQGLNV